MDETENEVAGARAREVSKSRDENFNAPPQFYDNEFEKDEHSQTLPGVLGHPEILRMYCLRSG
jgi:hypothetical protein